MTGELDKPIGTKDNPKLSASSVVVKTVEVVQKESGKKKFRIVELGCIHPEREELITLSNIMVKKVQGNNITISKDGIWYREDTDGNLDKNCNASKLLSVYGKSSLRMLENASLNTEMEANGYLCIKAY